MTSRSSVRVVVEIELRSPSRSVGEEIAAAGFAAAGGGNGSQSFTAPVLAVLRLISLTVALAPGSAHATGLDASRI